MAGPGIHPTSQTHSLAGGAHMPQGLERKSAAEVRDRRALGQLQGSILPSGAVKKWLCGAVRPHLLQQPSCALEQGSGAQPPSVRSIHPDSQAELQPSLACQLSLPAPSQAVGPEGVATSTTVHLTPASDPSLPPHITAPGKLGER